MDQNDTSDVSDKIFQRILKNNWDKIWISNGILKNIIWWYLFEINNLL
jgi:hypothetical protein